MEIKNLQPAAGHRYVVQNGEIFYQILKPPTDGGSWINAPFAPHYAPQVYLSLITTLMDLTSNYLQSRKIEEFAAGRERLTQIGLEEFASGIIAALVEEKSLAIEFDVQIHPDGMTTSLLNPRFSTLSN